MKQKKKIAREERIPVGLSIEDRDLILDHTLIDPDPIQLLKTSEPEKGMITIHLTLDDLDDILGCIAFEVNHTNDPNVEAVLGKVYDRLADIESMFEMLAD